MSKINQYDEIANFLMFVADQETRLTKTCGISPSEALTFLRPLHAMIDEEIKRAPHLTAELVANCETDCHCGIYSDLEGQNSIKEFLYKKAKEMPKTSLLLCAQVSANWICDSNLLRTLQSEGSTTGLIQGN